MSYIKINIALLLLMIFNSCTKVIEFPIPANEPKNVINCILAADSSLGGFFYETLAINSPDTVMPIKNGRMVILDDQGSQAAFQLNSNSGGYFSANKAQANQCYTVEFSSDLGTSNATICIPSAPKVSIIDSIITQKGNDTVYQIKIALEDELVNDNYYRFVSETYQISSIKFNSQGKLDTLFSWQTAAFTSTNLNLFVNEYNYDDQSYLLKDDNFKDNIANLEFNVPALASYKIRFRIEHIDKSLFEYYRTFGAQKFVQTDPNAHYVNVFNNVKNGFGIFGGKNCYELAFSRP